MKKHLEKRGNTYWMDVTIGGRRHRKSLKTNNLDHALSMHDEIMVVVNAIKRAESSDERDAIIEAHLAALKSRRKQRGAILNSSLISDAPKAYRASKRRSSGTADSTLDSYERTWRALEAWLPKSVHFVHQVTPEHAEAYTAYLGGKHVSGTVVRHLTAIRMYFKVLYPDLPCPFDGVGPTKESEVRSYRALSINEVRRVYDALSGEFKGLWMLGYYTALDLGDCCCLDWNDVDLGSGLIYHFRAKTKRRAPRRMPPLPVSIELREMLMRTPPTWREGPVLPLICSVYKGSPSSVSRAISSTMRRAGVVPTDGTRIGFKCLRHTMQTNMDEAGIPRAISQGVMQHITKGMSDVYSHISNEARMDAVNLALPRICPSANSS